MCLQSFVARSHTQINDVGCLKYLLRTSKKGMGTESTLNFDYFDSYGQKSNKKPAGFFLKTAGFFSK
jgi:hypothetical protein